MKEMNGQKTRFTNTCAILVIFLANQNGQIGSTSSSLFSAINFPFFATSAKRVLLCCTQSSSIVEKKNESRWKCQSIYELELLKKYIFSFSFLALILCHCSKPHCTSAWKLYTSRSMVRWPQNSPLTWSRVVFLYFVSAFHSSKNVSMWFIKIKNKWANCRARNSLPSTITWQHGWLAQVVECSLWVREVGGSSPSSPFPFCLTCSGKQHRTGEKGNKEQSWNEWWFEITFFLPNHSSNKHIWLYFLSNPAVCFCYQIIPSTYENICTTIPHIKLSGDVVSSHEDELLATKWSKIDQLFWVFFSSFNMFLSIDVIPIDLSLFLLSITQCPQTVVFFTNSRSKVVVFKTLSWQWRTDKIVLICLSFFLHVLFWTIKLTNWLYWQCGVDCANMNWWCVDQSCLRGCQNKKQPFCLKKLNQNVKNETTSSNLFSFTQKQAHIQNRKVQKKTQIHTPTRWMHLHFFGNEIRWFH